MWRSMVSAKLWMINKTSITVLLFSILFCDVFVQWIIVFCSLSLGLTFVEKWNTNNVLTTEVSMEDYLVKGLKVAFDSSFAPQTRLLFYTIGNNFFFFPILYELNWIDLLLSYSKKSGSISSAFKNDCCALNCNVDLLNGAPQILASTVIAYNG